MGGAVGGCVRTKSASWSVGSLATGSVTSHVTTAASMVSAV